jgi:V8-like Glu-specific endopeptidase
VSRAAAGVRLGSAAAAAAVAALLAGCSGTLPSVSDESWYAAHKRLVEGNDAFRKGNSAEAIAHYEAGKRLINGNGRYAAGEHRFYAREALFESMIGHAHFWDGNVGAAGERWRNALTIRFTGAQGAQLAAQRAGDASKVLTMGAAGLLGAYAAREAGRGALTPEAAAASVEQVYEVTLQTLDGINDAHVDANVDPKVRQYGAPDAHVVRVPVTPDATPFIWTGRMYIRDYTSCTGTVVARRIVLTNAHCLGKGGERPAVPHILFRLERTEQETEWWVHAWHTAGGSFRDWDGRPENDWALLVLAKPWTVLDYFPDVAPETPADVRAGAAKLMMAGYSADLSRGAFLTLHHGCEGAPSSPEGLLHNNCDSHKGSSGSPIYSAAGGFRIVALNAAFYEDGRPYRHIAVDTRQFHGALRELMEKYP